MNERRYKLLRELLAIKRADALEQKAECEQTIKDTLEKIVSMENAKVTSIHEYSSGGWNVKLSIIDSEGKNAWGCDCNIYYEQESDYHEKKTEISCSSTSIKKDKTDDIHKITMTYRLSQALEEIEQMFDNLKRDKMDDYSDTRFEVEWAMRDLKRDYAEQIESGLAVGKEYKDKYDHTLKIEKITPKFVHYTKDESDYWTKERKSDFLDKQARLKFEEFEKTLKEQTEDTEQE